jgi:hypothetical protein
MATIVKLSSGRWRAQVRRDGHILGRTFTNKGEAKNWAIDREAISGQIEAQKGRGHGLDMSEPKAI